MTDTRAGRPSVQVVVGDAQQVAARAADVVEELLRERPDAVLGLATGSSPEALYAELVRRHERGLSFARTRAVLLDEYVGLPAEHPQRYANVIRRELTDALDIDPAAVHSLSGDVTSPEEVAAEVARYEDLVRGLGVDVQVLGIGHDGHLAFNMPGTPFDARTHAEELSASTVQANARFFGGDPGAVPRRVLTQGLGTILAARRLLVLADGEDKAEAVRRTVEGPVSEDWPASVLQRHPDVTLYVDTAAGSLLNAPRA